MVKSGHTSTSLSMTREFYFVTLSAVEE